MSRQTLLPWCSPARGRGGGSKDERDIDMKQTQAAATAASSSSSAAPSRHSERKIIRAARSHSLASGMAQPASLPSPAPLIPPAAASSSTASSAAASSWSSVLGKRSSRASHLIFLPSDRSDPLDFSDFEQIKLPAHSLLYLVVAAQPARTAHPHVSIQPQHQSSSSSSSQQPDDAAAMLDDDDDGSEKEEKREEKTSDSRRNGGHGGHARIPVLPPVIEAEEDEEQADGGYDSISKLGDDAERGHSGLGQADYHRLHRSLAAAQRSAAAAAASSPQQRYKVMELSCREALHILHINAQQREAIAAAAADSAVASSSLCSASSSSSSPSAVQPSPLLCYLLSSHNDCVGYDCAEAEGGSECVVLTRDCCDSLLLLLDDDKQSGVAQQLLTDMFARISLRK